MDEIKRLGYPLLIIFLSALLVKLISLYITGNFVSLLLTLISVSALFLFGVSLNKSRKRRNQAVFKKVLAVVMAMFLLLMQLDVFVIPAVSRFLFFFGVNSFFINMIYIFCGYMFAD